MCYKKLIYFCCSTNSDHSIDKSIDYFTFSPMHNSIIELFLIGISCVQAFMSKSFTKKMKKVLLMTFSLGLCLAQGPTSARMLDGLENIDVSEWLASTPEVITTIK